MKAKNIIAAGLGAIMTFAAVLAAPVDAHAAGQWHTDATGRSWYTDANGWEFEAEEFGYGMDILNETMYAIADKVIYDKPVDGNPVAVIPAGQGFTAAGLFSRLSLYGTSNSYQEYGLDSTEMLKVQWSGVVGYIAVYFWEDITDDPVEAAEPSQETLTKIQRRVNACALLEELKNSDMTDREKVKAVHDWICLNVEYDYENYVNGTIPAVSHEAEGAILYGTAVCEGYALAFDAFMDSLGIEYKLITGTSNSGEGHGWNKVKLDGVWYYIDVTWDDPAGTAPDYVRYNYFLISEEQMRKDHQWVEYNADPTDISNRPAGVTEEQWESFLRCMNSLRTQQ